jgi:hypothetical protein
VQLADCVKAIHATSQSAGWCTAAAVMSLACATPREQREIAAADAETFEVIVRSQVIDSANPGFLRVDARPAGDKEILPPTSETAPGFDPDSSADNVAEGATQLITDQRKEILRDLHIEEGGPFFYPDCGGFRTRRFRDSSAVHPQPDCPKEFHHYVTVGAPTRGASTVLTKARRPETAPPDTTGELWTVLVTETSVGPGGQQWRQYAWLFRREPQNGRLGVAEKLLLSWAE